MDYQAGRRPSYDSRWRTSFDETSLSGHRPVSRRGIHDYSPPLSHIQSSVMRPNSAYRSSTASRLATAGLGQPPSSAARVGTAMTGFSMVDRPITQQGLSGLRTGTARGYRTRQLQDKRYWEELMQVKIREIKAETANLNERADVSERERSANKHYEKRVKELAQELTDLQGRLADYNTAIRISTGAITKSAVINETKEFEGSNQNLEVEVEKAFMEKQRKEVQLKQLKEQMDKERSSLEKLIAKMTATQLERYNELTQNNATLKEEIEHIQSQIEEVNKEKDQTHKEISMSQMKVHLLELYRRLDEAEEKRNTLHKEFDNKLQPHEEREKLLAQVREDNVAIASMESNSSTLKEQINKVQELIDHAEQDLEEGQSERHQKYRELKKREETMELFMETYEENARQEKEKIAQLEKHILFALEHSSMNLDIDLGEIEALKLKDESLYSMTENENARTVEGLTKEYERLQNNLKKLVTTRERLAAELQTLPDKMAAMEEELITLSDLERLRSEGAEKKKSLETELITLKEKLTPTENAVKEAANKLKELQSQLDGNEMYKKLNTLEDKLAQLGSSKSVLEEDIASITTKSDYEPIKKDALDTLNIINKKLQDDLHKSLY